MSLAWKLERFSAVSYTHLDVYKRQGQEQVGKPALEMNKNEKIEFIRFLDQKGAFLITKSGEQICELLGISKFTFYNYLEISRSQSDSSDSDQT